MKESLTFDDVLLIPQYSTVKSRRDVDVSVQLGPYRFEHPIVLANMKSVVGSHSISEAVWASSGLFIMDRFSSLQDQIKYLRMHTHGSASIGVKDIDKANAYNFYHKEGISIFTIDIAQGHSEACINMIQYLKKSFKYCFVIAGNVATGRGAYELWKAGADCVKIGVGPSMVCTTRGQTGFGVPQLSALMEVHDTRRIYFKNKWIIADGGITSPGSAVKALCWSDLVMIGGMFAGCDEAPGEIKTINGVTYKKYEGSSTYKSSHVEGVKGWVKSSGLYEHVLGNILEGIRSGCSYAGVHSVHDLQSNPKYNIITNSGLRESHPHDIILDS
jgi:IMP dehydrogenase/GMP reductase